MFDNDLGASLVFALLFLSSLVGLLFLLAWLEQPAPERWRPRWWQDRPGRTAAMGPGRHKNQASVSVARVGVPRR